MNFNMKKIFSALVLMLSCVLTFSLSANTVKLNVGFWPGELDPELEERFFLDDLVSASGIGRLDMEWDNKNTNTIYPLGLGYETKVGPGDIVLQANYMQYNPDYKFTGLAVGPAFSMVSLMDYSINDLEAEGGYRFHLLGNTLNITPKIGFRKHNKSFQLDELTIGSSTIIKTIDSNFEAQTSGLYLGVDLQYYLTKEFSLVASYIGKSAAWSGTASQFKTTAGVSGSTAAFTYESADSGYELSIERYSLGVQYDLGTDWHFQAGLREEKLTQSYPGYFNLAFGSGGITYAVTEIFTDYIIYSQDITQTKGMLYVSATYDIDM